MTSTIINNTETNGNGKSFLKRRRVCFAAMLLTCLCAGFGYAWSVMQTPIVSNYGWQAASVSLTFTITVVFSTLTPLFFGKIIGKMPVRRTVFIGAFIYGFGLFATGLMTSLWQLYLFYGVFSGLGCGMIYPTMMAYSIKLFPEKPGFSSGLATAAYGAGAIVWAPVAVSLTETFSLKSAFNILGICFAAVILLMSFLLKEPPKDFMPISSDTDKGASADKSENAAGSENDLRRNQMVKTAKFYLTVITFTFGLSAGLMIISQASPILQQSLGFTPATAAIFVSAFAACNMAGRFLWGGVSDKIGLKKSIAGIFIVAIIAMSALSVMGIPVLMLVTMGVAASCYGGLASVLTPLTAKMFGRRYITENYGVMYIVFGLASLVAPNLAIMFKNASGNYTGAYITAAILAVTGLILANYLNPKCDKKD